MVSLTSNKHYIGDTVHILSIVNIIIFIGFLIANAKGFGIDFSPAFAKDGYCVSNKDQHILLQSHAICLRGYDLRPPPLVPGQSRRQRSHSCQGSFHSQ